MNLDLVAALTLFCTVAFFVYRKIDRLQEAILHLEVDFSQRITRIETLLEERTR